MREARCERRPRLPHPGLSSFSNRCARSRPTRRTGDDYLMSMSRSTPRGLRLAALLSLAACGGSHTAPPPAAPATALRTAPRLVAALHAVRVNETLLNYRLVGDQGTAVVFVHDSYGDLDDWSAQLATFAATHRVLVYCRRSASPRPTSSDRATGHMSRSLSPMSTPTSSARSSSPSRP